MKNVILQLFILKLFISMYYIDIFALKSTNKTHLENKQFYLYQELNIKS